MPHRWTVVVQLQRFASHHWHHLAHIWSSVCFSSHRPAGTHLGLSSHCRCGPWLELATVQVRMVCSACFLSPLVITHALSSDTMILGGGSIVFCWCGGWKWLSCSKARFLHGGKFSLFYLVAVLACMVTRAKPRPITQPGWMDNNKYWKKQTWASDHLTVAWSKMNEWAVSPSPRVIKVLLPVLTGLRASCSV